MKDLELAVERLKRDTKQSLYFLCKTILGFKDINQETHGEIIRTMESEGKRKLICVPRGCLKSSIACVAYPIWLLLNNANLRILIDSELYTNSKNFLREIKAHLHLPIILKMFGDFESSVWNESEIIINQRNIIKKEASITVGGVGTTKVGQHFDVIIGDDMNSMQNSGTQENAEKVVTHYKMNLSILEPTGTYVIIGTRYSEMDLIGYIIENEIREEGLLA